MAFIMTNDDEITWREKITHLRDFFEVEGTLLESIESESCFSNVHIRKASDFEELKTGKVKCIKGNIQVQRNLTVEK